MRLLSVHTLEFREYHGDDVPKYAIASHRWYAGSEATLKDVRRKRNTETTGFLKVLAFTRYVREHISGIDWIWIDTCCIDQKSSQEVSEAINSMFKWYSNAEVCLAYLADVERIEDVAHSDWWSRGWTLQELLAPRTVVFLTRDWQVAGSKGGDRCNAALKCGNSVEASIASLTGIPLPVLRDYEASEGIGVQQKLAWTDKRNTTREEDLSYCLFGIFGVAIGANYGEGKERARHRLLREIAMTRDASVFLEGSVAPPLPSISSMHGMRTDKQAMQRLMASLYFPQMNDRRESIQSAHEGTYRWALLSTSATNVRWDNLAGWLSDPRPPHRLYWVNAKPGAGKSGLIRFLDEELSPIQHMQPWAEQMRVVRLSYYFWNPGNTLQKSLTGVLRTLLHQLFDAIPGSLLPCVSSQKDRMAREAGGSGLTWSDVELRECFRKIMAALLSEVKVFVLIDGLDEIDGDDDTREDLVGLLQELTSYSNVKLCVSSRRWPLFQDAFASCPQLRLEDLNAHDIEQFVNAQLGSQSRFRNMPGRDALVRGVIAKADGVFLWTRLVVKDLVRGIRDGDSLDILQQKLHAVPADLNEYFAQLLNSIEPHHRSEAGILLQLALHEEDGFIALNPLHLIDLVFISPAETDFALSEEHKEEYLRLFQDTDALIFALDSTLRRLSSRCKGLLQCNLHTPGASHRAITALTTPIIHMVRGNKHMVLHFQIDFMHRSLRDYLQESGAQELLGGTFDARNYLRNARLMLILMRMNATPSPKFDVGLASYFLCTLSLPIFRGERRCAQFAAAFRPMIESVMKDRDRSFERYWYICRSLETWEEEQGSFLTLAIDFGLKGYIAQNIDSRAVREKKGRPMLDYVLRPRFANGFDGCSIGNHFPIPELVQQLISLGADPNQEMWATGISIWTLFLTFVAEYDYGCAGGEEGDMACVLSVGHMIEGGASLYVRHADLSSRLKSALARSAASPRSMPRLTTGSALAQDEGAGRGGAVNTFETPIAKIDSTLRNATASHTEKISRDGMVSVEDILECMRPGLGGHVDDLIELVRRRQGTPLVHSHARVA